MPQTPKPSPVPCEPGYLQRHVRRWFAVYSGRGRPGHACVVVASDKVSALKTARSNGIVLERAAWAEPLTIQRYADMLRGCGIKVSGVPEQLALMGEPNMQISNPSENEKR